jgi:putative ABC transport system permease protein
MFLRILTKAMTHRRNRLGVATVALVVGSSVTTAMLSVYYDAGRKMNRELRAYGANVMLGPKDGSSFDQSVMNTLASGEWPAEILAAAPFLYIVGEVSKTHRNTTPLASLIAAAPQSSPDTAQGAQTGGPRAIVVTGTWLDQARKASPWWQVKGDLMQSPDDEADCLAGSHLASQLHLNQNDWIELSYASARQQFKVAGILDTGGPEDDQVVISLNAAQRLSGLPDRLSAVAISASGRPDRVESMASSIGSRVPGVRADLVRQIAESEGRILGRLRLTMLLVVLLILIAASLSVGTTLTALVMDRRKEIGTMKAIGAEGSDLMRLFLFELAGLGLAGGSIGYAGGMILAQPIGRSLFNSAVAPRLAVFAIVLIISLAVAMLSAVVPIKRIKEVQPAVILKGD